MSCKLKLRIVAGINFDLSVDSLWENLSHHYDIEILVIGRCESSSATSSVPKVFFPALDGMPGFLKNVDSFLEGSSIIIGVGLSTLASFQALRFCRANSIPFFAISYDTNPFAYDLYNNLKAIQTDILENSSGFLVSSEKQRRFLLHNGISTDSIVDVAAGNFSVDDCFSSKLREKFRKYIGIPENCFLVGIKTDFINKESIEGVANGIKLFVEKQSIQNRSKLRFLFLGNGPNFEQTKYLVSSLGVGKNCLFLSQDSRGFWRDVCSAVDAFIWEANIEDLDGSLKLFSAAAMNGKAILLNDLDGFSTYSKIGIEVSMKDLDCFNVKNFIEENFCKDEYKNMEIQMWKSSELALKFKASFNRVVSDLDRIFNAKIDPNHRFMSKVNIVKEFIERHADICSSLDANDILVRCEEFLLFKNITKAEKSELCRIKGDALMSSGDPTEAMLAFELAILHDDNCARAFRGLGQLSLNSYSHEEAISFFKKSLSLNANDYHCLVGVGLIYRRLKLHDEALFWLEKSIAIRGASCSAFSLAIQSCLEYPTSSSSLVFLERLREFFGDLNILIQPLHQIYLAHGLFEKASLVGGGDVAA
ncbi:MAG: hypothetical protein NT027_19075 [Proteobacteria bacterium]|nr:hypothetical protein [Pseudomonadota bacterium]